MVPSLSFSSVPGEEIELVSIIPTQVDEVQTLKELKQKASRLVDKIDFSQNRYVENSWIVELSQLFPNLKRLNLTGCQSIPTDCKPLKEFKCLVHLTLTDSNLSMEQIFDNLFDQDGHSSLQIECYDAKKNIDLLGRAFQLATFFSNFVQKCNPPPADRIKCQRQWNILKNLTQNHSWKEEELIDLLTCQCLSTDPQVQEWKALAATVLSPEKLPIPIKLSGFTATPESHPPGLYRFIFQLRKN